MVVIAVIHSDPFCASIEKEDGDSRTLEYGQIRNELTIGITLPWIWKVREAGRTEDTEPVLRVHTKGARGVVKPSPVAVTSKGTTKHLLSLLIPAKKDRNASNTIVSL